MKNVIVRSISGIIYVGLIIGAIFIGPIAFILLTTIFVCLAMAEFSNMAHIGAEGVRKSPMAQAIDSQGVFFITSIPAICFPSGYALTSALCIAGAYILLRAVVALYDKRPTAYREVAKSVFGVMYISLPLMMLNILYISDIENTRWIVLMMFAMIWLNDTGAFCFGSMLGKHRLFERLSPKKSWEGFWGGMFCCIVCGVVCSMVFDIPHFNIVAWIALSILVSVFSTWGDLFESMLKRTVKVKDSGSLIPGHGGILDRIDSLLFVAPVTYIVYTLAYII